MALNLQGTYCLYDHWIIGLTDVSRSASAWNSLVEGDEQPDWPNSQSSMECCHACATYFLGFVKNTTAYHLGRYSLQLLLLKSSMANLFIINH